MSDSTTVPRELVEELARGVHALLDMKQRQHATMAHMLRGCLAKIREDPRQSYIYRKAQGFTAEAQALKEHKIEVAQAFLHLEWLATQLENDAGDHVDLVHPAVTITIPSHVEG
jgi:hypothetical protein